MMYRLPQRGERTLVVDGLLLHVLVYVLHAALQHLQPAEEAIVGALALAEDVLRFVANFLVHARQQVEQDKSGE